MARTKIQISVTPVTPVTPDFLKVSRVLRTRIMRTGVTRTHLHGTREKFTHYSVTGVTVHLYGWDPSAAITCATTTDATLTFHNVCALLKITNGRGDGCNISVSGTRSSGGKMSVNYSNTFSLDTTDGSLSGGNQDYVDVHNVPNGKTIYIAIAPGTYSDFAASWQIEFNNGEITKSSSFTFEAGKIYDLGNTSSW